MKVEKKILMIFVVLSTIGGIYLSWPKEPPWRCGYIPTYTVRVAISPDGNYIVASESEYPGNLYFFNVSENVPIWIKNYRDFADVINIRTHNLVDLEISENGKYIVGLKSPGLFLIDKNGTPIWQNGPFSNPISVSISSDGSHIVAARMFYAYFFSWENSTPRWIFHGPELKIETGYWIPWFDSVEISSSGDYIVAGNDLGLHLLSRENNVPLWRYRASINSVSISSDGSCIAAGTDNGLYLFTREDNIPSWTYSAGGVSFVTVSDDGNYIVTVNNLDESNHINLFSRAENIPIWSVVFTIPDPDIYYSAVIQPRISSNGRYLAFTDADNLFVYDRVENTLVVNLAPPFEGNINSLAMSSDGNHIVLGVYIRAYSGDVNNRIVLFSVPENRVLWVF